MKITAVSMDELASALPAPITALPIRGGQSGFPKDIATQRRPPYRVGRLDHVLQVLAEVAAERGWDICTYDAKNVEAEAAAILGPRADEVLHGPRTTLGPPWSKTIGPRLQQQS